MKEYIVTVGDIILNADNEEEARSQAIEMIMQGDYELDIVVEL